MKAIVLFLLLFYTCSAGAQPVRIHSHNDYRQPRPLQEALMQRVYSLEADVFLYQEQLRVAHDEAELPGAPLLDSLYLQPLLHWMTHRPSGKIFQLPYLLIDIKSNPAVVLPALVTLLAKYPVLFNPEGMRVVISGERGSPADWTSWPGYILFDGRPGEQYDAMLLTRVAFISDAYKHYADRPRKKIKQQSRHIHQQGKLLRLWGIPDDPGSWKKMISWGVDIINTDQVKACTDFFKE